MQSSWGGEQTGSHGERTHGIYGREYTVHTTGNPNDNWERQ